MRQLAAIVLSLIAISPISAIAQTAATPTTDEFVGLWKAKRRFGPDARGPLLIQKNGATYSADVMGRRLPVRFDNAELKVDLPDNQGSFRGKFEGKNILGHWWRPSTPVNGFGRPTPVSLSPILLRADGVNRWRGDINPVEDTFTFYLLLQKAADGSLTAVLRNPEFDLGGQQRVEKLVRDGNSLKLIGKRGGQERVVATGGYDKETEFMTLFFPNRGGSYDFHRDTDDSEFYPRRKTPGRYVYQQPPPFDDGWPTSTLEEANIDRPAIERFMQTLIDLPMDSTDAAQVHSVLIARHGKLVLEEYFHGEYRDKLHTTRSAGKSVTSVLVGAAMQAGAPLKLSSLIYEVMNGGKLPADLEPQKRTMTLEHLLTMSAGYFCDDTNEQAPGNENGMWEQEAEPDFYRFIMKVPLVTPPGENAVYCSAMPNLALGLVGRATGQLPVYAFDRLLAEPMKIRNYSWGLDPAGNPYGGGSVAFTARDFMKFGQLMLNDGMWERRRILSHDFVARSSSSLYHLRGITYGYLWWAEEFPYKNRSVHAFMALGAGAQSVIVVPELDLVVATFGGSFSSRVQLEITHLWIPRYILPAVRETGDDKNAPVTEREYKTPYGPSKDGSRVKP